MHRATITWPEVKYLLNLSHPGFGLWPKGGCGSPSVLVFRGWPYSMPGQTKVPRESAEFGALDPAVDVDPFDGVAFLYVINIFQEVQVEVESIRGLH